MLIDTHAHLWWESYSNDLPDVITRATEKGVCKFVAPGTDIATSILAINLAKKYPGQIYAAVGIHPEEIEKIEDLNREIETLQKLTRDNREYIVAIGEVGTDSYTEDLRLRLDEQKILFKLQCELAQSMNLPVIVHTRESLGETLEVVDQLGEGLRGVFHCFSYDVLGMEEVIKRGFMVGICGNVSWSKKIQKMVAQIPSNRYMLETDSPLMIPRDHKGEKIVVGLRNEPTSVTMIAEIVANLRNMSLNEIEEETTKTAKELFNI